MNSHAYSVISDTTATEDELLQAFRDLGDVEEPPTFWTSIANDPAYTEWRRAYCVLLLFRRHTSAGMTLTDLSKVLQPLDWLHDEDVAVVSEITGELPVRWRLEDTVIVLTLFRDPSLHPIAVYLRIQGRVDRNEFLGVLRGRPVNEATATAVVVEIGFMQPPGLAGS